MLVQLSIRNVVLIESLDFNFLKGMTVFTGETGAGKSILLDALNLALGARADVGLIKKSANTATVTAAFQGIPLSVREILEQLAIPMETEGLLVLRRQIQSDRISRAFINDVPVTVQSLRAVAKHLLDIHGQFDALETQEDFRDALDAFLPLTLRLSVTEAFHAWKEACLQLETFQKQIQESSVMVESWSKSVQDIRKLNLVEGEVQALEAQKQLLENKGKWVAIFKDLESIFEAHFNVLRAEGERALSKLTAIAAHYEPYLERFSSAALDIQDVYESIASHLGDMMQASFSLESIESRLFAIRALGRQHRCLPEELLKKCLELEARIEQVSNAQDHEKQLLDAVGHAYAHYLECARHLSEQRAEVAARISKAVQSDLPGLKLPDVRFNIEILSLPEEKWTSYGVDDVRFMVMMNAGAKPGLMQNIASGGERSRIALALKLSLASAYPGMSFVFDEVDSGVGGGVATAVGETLEKMSRSQQVFVITHSPQVAVFAHQHWRMLKLKDQDGHALTSAQVLSDSERQEEIARMLSGDRVSDEARAAASRLLRGK